MHVFCKHLDIPIHCIPWNLSLLFHVWGETNCCFCFCFRIKWSASQCSIFQGLLQNKQDEIVFLTNKVLSLEARRTYHFEVFHEKFLLFVHTSNLIQFHQKQSPWVFTATSCVQVLKSQTETSNSFTVDAQLGFLLPARASEGDENAASAQLGFFETQNALWHSLQCSVQW